MCVHSWCATSRRTAKGSYLQAQYQRLKPRIGHRRALGAVQHSMLVAYWHMFTTGETYRELSAATTTNGATPNASPNASSHAWNPSATTSSSKRSRRLPDPSVHHHPNDPSAVLTPT